jgi:hypothetical protein
VPFGLGEADAAATVYVQPDKDIVTSLIPDSDQLDRVSRLPASVQLVRGDEYCSRRGIERIDFIKMGVEGAEPQVLRGFLTMLVEHRIRTIQFEYSTYNILSRFFLRDFYDMLSPLGFKLGKLFPDHIRFAKWTPEDEDLAGPNFVATLDPERF